MVNNKNQIFEISSSVTKFFECNNEEGNTRIIFQTLQQKSNVAQGFLHGVGKIKVFKNV